MKVKYNEELIKLLRDYFRVSVSVKNGWGKNEVLRLLDEAIANAAIKLLDEKT